MVADRIRRKAIPHWSPAVRCVFPVLQRRQAAAFFKAFGKVKGIAEAQVIADLFNAVLRPAQLPLGKADQLLIDIAPKGDAYLPAELLRKEIGRASCRERV